MTPEFEATNKSPKSNLERVRTPTISPQPTVPTWMLGLGQTSYKVPSDAIPEAGEFPPVWRTADQFLGP